MPLNPASCTEDLTTWVSVTVWRILCSCPTLIYISLPYVYCLFVFPLNRCNISKTGLGGWKMKRNICFSEVLNISGTKKSQLLRSEDGKIHIFNQIQRNYLLYTCLISDFQCYIVRSNSNSVSASGPLPLSDAAT